MSHTKDAPKLTKKSSGLLKDWWSICVSNIFRGFNSMEGHKHLSRLFSDNLLAMLIGLMRFEAIIVNVWVNGDF